MSPRRILVPVVALLALAACGSSGGAAGGTGQQATVDCQSDVCTVTFPAKARNNQSSSGGPPAQVLGVAAQLFSIAGGQANLRIDDQPVTIEAGKKQTVGDLTVQAVSVSDTEAVLKISRTQAKATAKPKASAKAGANATSKSKS